MTFVCQCDMGRERKSNFELLRIISMLMIVMHHLAVHGGAVVTDASPAFSVAVLHFFDLGGKLAVNAFVLISGYFLVKSKFKPEKLFALIVEIFIYSTTIYFIFVSLGKVKFEWKALVYSFLPLSTNGYWFMTCYVLMYLVSPLVNIVLRHSTQKMHIALILIMFFICSIVPLYSDHILSDTAWFIFLYVTAAYIALYPQVFEKKWVFVVASTVLYLVIVLFKLFVHVSLDKMDNPICYLCSVSMFIMFKNMKIKFNSIINFVSSATLGVYLIHDNNYIRPFIWHDVFKIGEMFKSNDFWWKAIFVVIIVFIAGVVIDVLRRLILKFFDLFVDYNILSKKQGNFLHL